MQAEETKMILRYFGGIEAQLDDVNIELAELRDRYNPIKGIAMDGMPHGSTPGDSTASLAVKLADDVECQRRENELRVRKDVLRADQTTIRGQLDRLNSRYKTILCGRYTRGRRMARRISPRLSRCGSSAVRIIPTRSLLIRSWWKSFRKSATTSGSR